MKNTIGLVATIVSILALGIGGLALMQNTKAGHKTAYINTAELFNGFEAKKEVQKQFDAVRMQQKNVVDSLKFRINILQSRKDKAGLDELNTTAANYQRLSYDFEQSNQAQESKYIDQVWKQLNQYIADYGKENGYDYIFGANGTGELMYAKESRNITKEVLQYANGRYKGK